MKYKVVILLSVCSFSTAYCAGRKLDPDLSGLDSNQAVDVIVQYKSTPTEAHHQHALARSGQLKQCLDIIRAAHYSVPANQLQELSEDPLVEFIAPDRAVRATANSVYTGSPDYGWRTVGADLATSVFGLDGTGIGIALIDSGANQGNDLKNAQKLNRVVYQTSLVPNSDPNDHYGHGTHVSGILSGNGTNSSTSNSIYMVRGIAPSANLISIKVLNDSGVGSDSTVIAGIQLAIQLKAKYNIRVMNLSLGRPVSGSYLNDPLCQAVQQAWQAGIVVVVAAGNDGRNNSQGTNGYGTITAPGNSPFVITVGAMNTVGTLTPADDKIASYSSKGPTVIDHIVKPDLMAPGNRIISLNLGGSWFDSNYPANDVAMSVYSATSGKSGKDYFVLSGTSMAAPMVSGAAALIIQKNPLLTPDQVKARLMESATKFAPGFSSVTDPVTGITYTDAYDIFTIGAGYLNIPAALSNSDVFTGVALSPSATFSPATNSVVLAPTPLLASFGTNIRGSSARYNAIWGTSVFLNGTNAIWGSSARYNAIWGTSAIWGSSVGSDASESTTIAVQGDN
jgi:serine protease AprX